MAEREFERWMFSFRTLGVTLELFAFADNNIDTLNKKG